MSRLNLPAEEILLRYAAGEGPAEIARSLGVCRSTISRRLAVAAATRTAKGFLPTQVVGADGLRPCSTCGRRLSADSFHKNKARPDGLHNACRRCWSEYQAERTLMRKFGITLKTFNQLLREQGGGCKICGRKLGMIRAGKRLRLCIDHSHTTGLIRGILCNSCNNGIGRFQDNPELLERAAAYLRT